jgi:imidazolonepropionase-like amidohydrolase
VTRRLLACATLVAAALPAACDTLPFGKHPEVTALVGATLIDGSGGRPVEDAIILVDGGRITAVARVNEVEIPRGATVVDLVGKTVIPGLIDAHAHLERWAGQRFVAWGVTSVRDLSDRADTAMALRADFNLGAELGPRVFGSGGMIDGVPPTYPGADAVASAGTGRQAVDRRAVAGADWIKVHSRLSLDILRAILDEAATFRLPTAAHLGRIDALAAARAGVASIEHLSGVPQAAGRDAARIAAAYDDAYRGMRAEAVAWAALDSASLARTARALAETRVAVVPTVALWDVFARLGDTALFSRPGMADVPAGAASVRDPAPFTGRGVWSRSEAAVFARARPRQYQFVREYRRAGGLLGVGSDAVAPLLPPGAALHDELARLVAAGHAPLDAIAAATRRNAQLLRADSIGMVAPGKLADLVILNARPDSDIAATRDIHLVMLRGRLYPPDSLRRTWPK